MSRAVAREGKVKSLSEGNGVTLVSTLDPVN
jgi:hypothetical protein